MKCIASIFALFLGGVLALESNPFNSPQNLDQFTSVCNGRTNGCRVELDVPAACVQSSASDCPIIFHLHGAGGNIDNFSQSSGVHNEGMIGVYPQGEFNGWNTGPKQTNTCAWDDFACTTDPNEQRFITDIIVELRNLGANGNIYAYGNSNGAALAQKLAVNKGADLSFNGIIAHVTQLLASPERYGPGEINYNQPIDGNPSVSVMTVSGTDDPVIPYDGGTAGVFQNNPNFVLMSNDDSNFEWAKHNGCNGVPAETSMTTNLGSGTAVFMNYTDCNEGRLVEHYKIIGGLHNAGAAVLNGVPPREIRFDFIKRCERNALMVPSIAPASSPATNSVPSIAPAPVQGQSSEPSAANEPPSSILTAILAFLTSMIDLLSEILTLISTPAF